MSNSRIIYDACDENFFGQYVNACNMFLFKVASSVGLSCSYLNTNASSQVIALRGHPSWENLGLGDSGALAAISAADAGRFVVAGYQNTSGHGHVAIAVYGAPENGWPKGFWGQFPSGPGGRNRGLRYSFGQAVRPRTEFFATDL